jgi:Tol biopolymer transport system component
VAPDLVELLGSQPTLLYRQMQEEVLYAWDEGAERGYRLMDLSHMAGDLALSPAGYLAYTLDGVPYLADLSTGTIHQIYEDQDHPDPDWDLLWSTDGRALAYALTWKEPDGSRMIELGTYDGDERQVVTTLTARSGPPPTPSSKPPTLFHPGFSFLRLLGYDRSHGRILATPLGGKERYSAVWVFDASTGQTTLLTFDDPEAVEGMAASPGLAYLAAHLTPARIVVYDLAVPHTAPRTFTVPAGVYPVDLRWSPDGRWLAFLLCEGNAPGVAETSALGLWVLDTVTMQGREGLSLPRLDAPKLTSAGLTGWHPDGKTLLIEWHGGSPRRSHLQLIDTDSWQATELALGERARPIGWMQLAGGTR